MFANLTPRGYFSCDARSIPWLVWLPSRWELVLSNPLICPIDPGAWSGGGKPILAANWWTFSDSSCAPANAHKTLRRDIQDALHLSLIRTDVIPAESLFIQPFACVWYKGRRQRCQQCRNQGESSLMNQLRGHQKRGIGGFISGWAKKISNFSRCYWRRHWGFFNLSH